MPKGKCSTCKGKGSFTKQNSVVSICTDCGGTGSCYCKGHWKVTGFEGTKERFFEYWENTKSGKKVNHLILDQKTIFSNLSN